MLLAIHKGNLNNYLIPELCPSYVQIDPRSTLSLDAIKELTRKSRFILKHIDKTYTKRLPVSRNDFEKFSAESKVHLMNFAVDDISKNNIQTFNIRSNLPSTIAKESDPPNSLVIIKNNLNFGGIPESRWKDETTIPQIQYKIFKKRNVPLRYWNNRNYSVERFISNFENKTYRLYLCMDYWILCESICKNKIHKPWKDGVRVIDKGNSSTSKQPTCAGACSARETSLNFARRFQLDYGAIDIVINDNYEAFIIDVNTCPASPPHLSKEDRSHLSMAFCLHRKYADTEKF